MAAKNETQEVANVPEASNKLPVLKPPRLGDGIDVRAGIGRRVPNNDAGSYFDEKTTVTAIVDIRILRLLADGDLIQVPQK